MLPLRLRRCLAIIAGAMLAFAGLALAATHSNPTPIALTEDPNGPGPATPYPSPITVAGETTAVGDVNVTLSLISDEFPDDLDVLLVGPAGQKALIMSDAGTGLENGALAGATITLDDEAAQSLPDENQITSGSYKPANYGVTPDCDGVEPAEDTFPSPAPGPPYATTLSAFDSTAPNGVWNLYVVDDCFLFTPGTINGGWSLTILPPTAVRIAGLRARLAQEGVVLRWRTAAETDLLGFNVYRSAGARTTTKVNGSLIPAKAAGRAAGASYVLADWHAVAGASNTYRLQALGVGGQRTWVGSVRIKAPR
jgi:hypothetical protein